MRSAPMHGGSTTSWVWARRKAPDESVARMERSGNPGSLSIVKTPDYACAPSGLRSRARREHRALLRSGLIAHLAEQIIVVKILRDLRVEQQLLHKGVVAFLGALEQVALGGELVQMLLSRG